MHTPPALPGPITAFDDRADDYDRWFDEHPDVFQAELGAISALLDPARPAASAPDRLEIGVGTGRFAAALGIGSGVEPAPRMAALARQRGIHVTDAVAEALPFPDDRFALTAFITSLCFVTDPPRALAEASRVTRPGGSVLIAYLNLASAAGAHLAATQHEDPYFAHARLRTTTELRALLADADLAADGAQQVIAEAGQPPRVSSGADQGLFCVLRARVASTTKPPR